MCIRPWKFSWVHVGGLLGSFASRNVVIELCTNDVGTKVCQGLSQRCVQWRESFAKSRGLCRHLVADITDALVRSGKVASDIFIRPSDRGS